MPSSQRLTETAVSELLERSKDGDESAWGVLLQQDAERLLRSIRLRLDVRLQGRIDPSDVLQESFLSASQRRAEFFERAQIPFFIWLRLITMQKLAELHRHHLGVKARNAAREISLFAQIPPATSAVLAAKLLGQTTTPSRQVAQEEMERRLREALETMPDADREIIALRNFEQLSNVEAASALDIPASTASSRYLRALAKLKETLGPLGGDML